MQRELRELLERKAAMGSHGFLGGDYYYDMSGQGEFDDGQLVAGARRRKRRVGRKKETKAQVKARMAKVRAGKKHKKGGDFVDLDDLMPYIGAGRGKAVREKAYRNPIEKAERDLYKQEMSEDWLLTSGPEYAAKLKKKADILNRALANTRMNTVADQYNQLYQGQLAEYSGYDPYIRAAQRSGIPIRGPALPGNPPIPYRVALGNARRGLRGEAAYAGADAAAILQAALDAQYN